MGFCTEFEDLTGKQARVIEADYDYLDSLEIIRAMFKEASHPEAIFLCDGQSRYGSDGRGSFRVRISVSQKIYK